MQLLFCRNFTKIRAQIEKDYGTAMVKLATTYLAKKPPPGIDYKTEDKAEIKYVFIIKKKLFTPVSVHKLSDT